ncbi:MAG TPA: TonB-dependent receptor [Gemmatimonadales bacterium]|jgi:vitamin B12 transporter|nr:TonB-dependent receptor [Gemmatimonadales bacterium]
MHTRYCRALPLLVLLPIGLAAQQPTDTLTLRPVVVTATRLPTPADAVPAAVTVISGAQLAAQGIRTVADALRTVPAASVLVTDAYGSQTSLFLRGGESDYVKVLIDGVPQNAPGGAYDFANLTTDNIDRIEVVRGPVSVLYGSDAVTGVVQIFTRDGHGAAHGSVALAGGTYGTSALELALAGGDERAGYAVGVSRFASNGVYAIDNQYRNEVVSARVRFRPDARNDAALSFRYDDAPYQFPTDASGAVVSNNQHQLARGPSVGLDLGHVFAGRVEGRVTGDWTRANYQYAIGPNNPSDTQTFAFQSADWVTRQGLDARANVRLWANDVLTAGAAFEHQAMEGSTLAGAHSRDDGAAYAQFATGLEQPLNFALGARVEDNQRFGTYATYRAAASGRIAAHTRVIASVGTGFKEPSFYQNFATGFVRGNPDLKPEHTVSWETGVVQAVAGGRVTVSGTYFHERFRDLIQYTGQPVGPDSVNYINVAEARAQGVELSVRWAVAAPVSVDASYTYLDSQDAATGQRLQRRPAHLGNVRLGYQIAQRASASLAAVFTGDRDDYDYSGFPAARVTLPPHTRVDLAGTYVLSEARGAVPGFAVNARIENLLNAGYEDIQGFPARRRTILAGGRLVWGS